jgi:hypothetical protein
MMDAARLLPVLGGVLVMIPTLWQPEQTAAPDTAHGAVYLFAVWAALVLAAMTMSKGLAAAMTEEEEAAESERAAAGTGSYLDQPMRGGQVYSQPPPSAPANPAKETG